jgi:high-affinity nickel-transport protein
MVDGHPACLGNRGLVGRAFLALGPWTLIVIGALNLWRMVRGNRNPPTVVWPILAQPFLLGIMLAAGFETASQLSALLLAGRSNPWLLGLAFPAVWSWWTD